MVQNDLKEKGYNKEEEYFHEQNKKLLKKKKREMEKKEKQTPQNISSEDSNKPHSNFK